MKIKTKVKNIPLKIETEKNKILKAPPKLPTIDATKLQKVEGKNFLKEKKSFKDRIILKTFSPVVPLVEEALKGKEFYDIQQPMLLLIRNTMKIETYEGVEEGIFKVENIKTDNLTREETREVNGILLASSKLLDWPYGEDAETGKPYHIRMWIAFEGEATPYPTDIKHDSNLIVTFYERMLANMGLLNDEGSMSKWMKWLLIGGAVIAIGAYLAYEFGLLDQFFAPVQVAAKTINNTLGTTAQQITTNQAAQAGVITIT